MPQSQYARGRAKEYAIKTALETLGYTCSRSASSKGLWDVMGVRFDGTVLVQAKLTSTGDFSEDENCALLRELPVHPSVRKELWLYVAEKGLVEVRDLKDSKPDYRTEAGKLQRVANQERAAQISQSVKLRKKQMKNGN